MMKQFLFAILFFTLFADYSIGQTDVQNWLILGPFVPKTGSELTNQNFIDPLTEQPRGGKNSSGKIWRLYKKPMIDFYDPLVNEDNVGNSVYYASVYIHVRGNRSVEKLIELGYSEGLTLYINGRDEYNVVKPGGLDVTSEKIYINLKPGWNTLLFRLINTKGPFYFRAGFSDYNNILVQTDFPFTAGQNEYYTLRILPIEEERLNNITLTESGRFLTSINRTYTNSGLAEAEKLRYQVFINNEKVLAKNIGKIKGGEIFGFNFLVSVDEFLQKEKPRFEVKLFNKDREVLSDTSFSDNIFRGFTASLFSPITIKGWEREVKHGKVIFSREFYIPSAFENLGLDFFVDIGSNLSTIKVNDAVVKEKFWEESGDVKIADRLLRGSKYKIEVISDSKDRNGNPVSLRYACLYLRNSFIEKILGNLYYSMRAGKKSSFETKDVYDKIFDILIKKDYENLKPLLTAVESNIESLNLDIKKRKIFNVGNAHIDMAWLWRIPETIEVTRQTFKAVLDNFEKMPFLKFSHGQAQSYEWIEKRYPDLFNKIKQYIDSGRWEPVGGSWVENDLNLSSGEFTIRQFILGKQYFKEKFGKDVKIAYSPDVFGHPKSMPAILNTCGFDKYVFFRPLEEQNLFQWKYLDGSQILTHRPPGWFTSYDYWNRSNIAPDKNYFTNVAPADSIFHLKNNLRFFGVGDHGGGPTIKEIDRIMFLDSLKSYPSNSFSTLEEYYNSLDISAIRVDTLAGEFNPVFEGCYTSQSSAKYLNRRAEYYLPLAEMISAVASDYSFTYPKEMFKEIWKKALFNQFHDILPGSAIADVYLDSERDYDSIFMYCSLITDAALEKILQKVNTKGSKKEYIPIVVFNNLAWKRDAPVIIKLKNYWYDNKIAVIDNKRIDQPVQMLNITKDSTTFLFIAKDIPPVGFKTYWIRPEEKSKAPEPSQNGNGFIIENSFYKLSVDRISGSLYSMYDKLRKKELLDESALGNQFVVYNDGGSAWEIKLSGSEEAIISPKNISLIENNILRKTILVEYEYERSFLKQYITLYSDLPQIDFRNDIIWNEPGKLLKIRFPFCVNDSLHEAEIPFGTIKRKNDGNEYVTQKFTSLSDNDISIIIANDSKYGYSVFNNIFYITALRTPNDPDPKTDIGEHTFSYSITSTQNKEPFSSIMFGNEFNSPLQVKVTDQHTGKLSNVHSFLKLSNPKIILSAFKKAEDLSGIIIRAYNSSSAPESTVINLPETYRRVYETNALETFKGNNLGSGKYFTIKFKPGEIKTIKLVK